MAKGHLKDALSNRIATVAVGQAKGIIQGLTHELVARVYVRPVVA